LFRRRARFSRNRFAAPSDNLGMTRPRPIIPGTTYLVTRRCTQRQFLLKPSKLTTQIFTYCVAVMAARTSIQIHAVVVMGNHWHVVLTDPYGKLPKFLENVHKLVAKAVNASLGRWENLWATEPPSLVELSSSEDVIDKVAYLAANPVAAGLVDRPQRWPGLLAYSPSHSHTVERPKVFFRPNGSMPATARLDIVRAPMLAEMTQSDYGAALEAAIVHRVHEARAALKNQGRSFMGEREVLRQKTTDSPQSWAVRRGLRPRVAAKNKWRREEALQRLKDWEDAYRVALAAWSSGQRDVIFPHGTYALRVREGVACAPVPTVS
jgi:REP element-mobilizing transposase RayT